MSSNLHIYHINDLHSHFEKWPHIVHFIKERRKEHEERNEACLFLDIGDFIDRSHPITEASYGKWNTELLNEIDVDFITIGNNEGITLSHQQLDTLYEKKKFPILVCNLAYANGEKPSWVQPYEIRSFSTYRIGFIGATVSFTGLYRQLGWQIEEPLTAISRTIKEIEKQVDYIVLLSHLGLRDDEALAQACPEIDVILGAHTHHVLEQGKIINDVLLCGAGKYGMYVGHVEIEFGKRITAELINTNSFIQMDMQTMMQLKELERKAETALGKKVMFLQEDLQIHWFEDTPFIRQLAEGIRQWCQGDIGMVNAGVLLHSLEKGPVTKKHIHSMCPHPINPCAIEVEGKLLEEMIQLSRKNEIEQLEVKGLGFRGKVMGKMVYDGLTEKNGIIYIQDEPLEQTRIYRLATLDMFTFGYIFPELAKRNITYFMPELLRDVVEWKLSQ